MATVQELADRFRDFGGVSTRTRAPLYTRLSAAIAEDPDVLRMLQHAPEQQQLPMLLFASVHFLLLGGAAPELAAHYPNLSAAAAPDTDPTALFRSFALDHADVLVQLLTTRSTQTNEVGRCAQFLPAFGLLDAEVGSLAHLDVGTSAGLNLLLPRFAYEYSQSGSVEPAQQSPVRLHCKERGDLPVPLPARMPEVTHSVGLDLAPIDVLDDDQVRWLQACVWPDQADRCERLVAAIGMARQDPPKIHQGDALSDLAPLVEQALPHGHPVVTNSWVLNYLPDSVRREYVAELDRIGSRTDMSWVIAEAPSQTPGLPVPTTDPPEEITVITLVRWRQGERSVHRLGTTHPHGYWVQWEGLPHTK
ncbi:MAG: DUF2332 family protein [Actinobacteria bacterium]|uniref:Unannotated protein n=1 Tax=freshwater metagenome TaxID=449393 RepID=A0A6J7Q2C8_9ZZZZ|nr:DUF2332 family protein [Actinomycetota bacterium]MSW78051.1 DUF2332 family protein [Actinomycetota bacterium]MSX56389.1 DUF2332 family protein [Actinomycetota bacterium]MSX93407.1 DUF2332 family protein [Actinomycetota bacterium]MSZ83392.1 DUF2332 family protein [Actinomycetota bacterium]